MLYPAVPEASSSRPFPKGRLMSIQAGHQFGAEQLIRQEVNGTGENTILEQAVLQRSTIPKFVGEIRKKLPIPSVLAPPSASLSGPKTILRVGRKLGTGKSYASVVIARPAIGMAAFRRAWRRLAELARRCRMGEANVQLRSRERIVRSCRSVDGPNDAARQVHFIGIVPCYRSDNAAPTP